MEKDVLEYTEKELNELSTTELNSLYNEADMQESLYNTRQLVEKLAINSLYGAFSNRYFPLFNQDLARAITGNGRYYIQKLANYIDDELQSMIPMDKSYVTYGDTDSNYFTIEPFVEKAFKDKPGTIEEKTDFCDNFYKTIIEPVVQRSIDDFAEELNAFNVSVIKCDREAIADCMIQVAKKKYFARLLDDEGTRFSMDDPYYKKMGLEVIKSSTSIYSKKYLAESLPLMLDKTEQEMKDWISQRKDGFFSTRLPDIATVGGVSNLDYTLGDKGIPIGARSALVHNKYIEDNGLLDTFTPILSGDKTKRLYLLEPNPLNSNIVAFLDDKFIEIFKDYIDYDTNFEKGFKKPLDIMTTALKWDINKTTQALDDW